MMKRILFFFSLLMLSPAAVFAGGDVVNNGAGFRESQMVYIWDHIAEDLVTFRQTNPAKLTMAEVSTLKDLVAARKAFADDDKNLLFKKEVDYKFPIASNGQPATFVTPPTVGSVIVVNQDALYRHSNDGSYRQDYQESFLLLVQALLVQKPSSGSGLLLDKISQWLNAEVKVMNLVAYNLPQMQTKLVLNQVLVNDEVQIWNMNDDLQSKAPCSSIDMRPRRIAFSDLYYVDVQGTAATDASLEVVTGGKVTYDCESATQTRKVRGEIQWTIKFDRIAEPGKPTEIRFHKVGNIMEPFQDILYFNLQEF